MKKSQLQRIIQEEIQSALNLKEAYVPDNVKSYAKQRGVSSLVNKVAGWAEKVGRKITGGTAIGKNYGTLILDMGHQTSDIYINIDNQTVELYGEEVDSIDEFKEVYKNNMNANLKDNLEIGSILKFKDGETWKVTKFIGSSSNPKGVFAVPYGATKNSYVSVALEFSMEDLEKHQATLEESVTESVIAEAYAPTTDEIGEFWIVESPSNSKTTLNDICFMCKDLAYFANQIRGGLKESDIKGVFKDEAKAKELAGKLLSGKGITESTITEGNTISIPKLSDIDHTRLTKWMGSQFNSKSYNMKKSGKGFDIAIDKLSKDEQDALKDYLKSQKYMTESIITEGATKTILGIKFNIVPIQAGMKFEFKDASQFRKSGVNVNTLVDEITKMLDDKFGKGLFTFVPAGRDQSDPKVNGLEFKMNASNFFKGL